MTQQQVADRLGITQSAVRKWDNAKSRPSPEMYPRLAEVLGIPAEEVVRLFAPEAEAAAAGG